MPPHPTLDPQAAATTPLSTIPVFPAPLATTAPTATATSPTVRSPRRLRRGAHTALASAHLVPVAEGIAASQTLWGPLLDDDTATEPVRLFAAESYDVWLEHHVATDTDTDSTDSTIEGTESWARRRAGTTHVVAPLAEGLELHLGDVAAALDPHQAVVVPPAAQVLAAGAPAAAIHVYSPRRPLDSAIGPAQLPVQLASRFTHPSRPGRPTPGVPGRLTPAPAPLAVVAPTRAAEPARSSRPPQPTGPALVGVGPSAQLARRLVDRPELWLPHLHEIEEGRSYQRILDTREANAWIILWASGATIDLHDHGSSAATLAVVRGVLDETYRVRTEAEVHHRRLRSGSLVSFDRDHIHGVTNRGSATAASIHVYSPPLEQMTWFEGGHERIEHRSAAWTS